MARTAADRLISIAQALRYAVTDRLSLWTGRLLHETEYVPGDLLYEPDPLISVYVPTFNRRQILVDRALGSIAAQTYTNIEIIVAAHGCSDGTDELELKRPGWLTDRFRVIRVPRCQTYPPSPENHWLAGPVDPANAALKHCRGQWIARIDDDDIWTPDHLQILLRFAQGGNYEFVSSAYRTHEKIIRDDGGFPPIGGTQTWLYRSYLKGIRYNRQCWRKSWDRVNDTDLAQRFRNIGVRIGHINAILAEVLPRPGESTVGLEAYRRDAAGKLNHFAFR